ncbi:HNH endonuclease [Candidatus Altiarchaeota archaeon]
MAFNNEIVNVVWKKARIIEGYDSDKWRKDDCNAWIKRKSYDDRKSQYGWKIEQISPGGSDKISNLRPLQWENYTDTSDGRLVCKVTSYKTQNTQA